MRFELNCPTLYSPLAGRGKEPTLGHRAEADQCQERGPDAGQCWKHGEEAGPSWEPRAEAGQCWGYCEEAGQNWEPGAEAREDREDRAQACQARAKSERSKRGRGPRRGSSACARTDGKRCPAAALARAV